MFSNVNLYAVLASAISAMVLGFLWYGPLFGDPWMKMSGLTKEKMDEAKKKGMTKVYLFSFAGALVMALILAIFVNYSGVVSVSDGVEIGFLAWLGFVATSMLNSIFYDGKPAKLYLINAGYQLVSLGIMGAILAYWI